MKLLKILLSLAVLASAPAFANKELAQKNACLACHAVDKKLVGPSYLDVVKKYSAQSDAATMLAASIKKRGRW